MTVNFRATAEIQKSASHHGKGKVAEQPKEEVRPERKAAGTIYSKEKLVVGRENAVGGGETGFDKFKITTEAESALIDTVQDFIFRLDNPAIDSGILDPAQQSFIREFKKTYSDPKTHKFDESKLHEFATDFIRRPDGSGLVAGLVVAEWKIALYQKALGFHTVEKQGHRVVYRPELQSTGTDKDQVVEGQMGRVKRKILGFIPFGEKDGTVDAPHTRILKSETEANSRLPANERDKNTYWDMDFYPHPPNPVHAPGSPERIEYRFAGLTPAQVAYLKSAGIDVDAGTNAKVIADGPTNGSRDASAEMIRMRQIMDRLYTGRNAVYRALGKDNIDMNLVDVSTAARGYIREPSRFLMVDHRAGTPAGADVKTAIDRRMDVVIKDMEKRNKEVAKDAAEKAKVAKKQKESDRLVHLIKDKKDELSKDPPPPSEEDAGKIKTNQETIDVDEVKKTELEKTMEDGKKLPILKKATDDARLALGGDFALVETINKSVDSTGAAQPGSVIEAQEQYDVAQSATEDAKDARDRARTRQQRATDTYNALKPNTHDDVRASALLEYTATRDISAEETAYTTAKSAETAARRELTKRQAIRDKFKVEWQAHQDAQHALDEAVKIYREAAAKHGVVATGLDIYGITGLSIQESDIKTVIDATDAEVKKLTHENEVLTDPNQLAREHQQQVYEEFDVSITPEQKITDIEKRASEIKDKKKEQYVVPEAYKHYPEVYIQTLRVIFGDDITDFSRAEEFKKASRMVSPEVFFTYMQKIVTEPPPAVDAYDDNLRDVGKMKKLSSKILHDFVGDVMKAGAEGNLGILDPATITAIEDMQQRTAANIFIGPTTLADRNLLIGTLSKEIYHFESEDDLARLIWQRHGGGAYGGALGGGTATIASEDHAKAYAREIARLRNI
ncbi:MAG: hypothetical protein WA061_06270 [Microgenomates group bacterium]